MSGAILHTKTTLTDFSSEVQPSTQWNIISTLKEKKTTLPKNPVCLESSLKQKRLLRNRQIDTLSENKNNKKQRMSPENLHYEAILKKSSQT